VRLTDPQRVEIPLSLTLSDYLAIAALRSAGRQVRVELAENETVEPRWFSDPLEDLRQAPEASERTRTVKIYTEVDNRQQEIALLPGTFVHARIAGPVFSSAIVIPRDALVEGAVFVAVPADIASEGTESDQVLQISTLNSQPSTLNPSWFARVERRPVTAGRTLQSLVLIEDGLAPGEWIVTTNLDVIFDGARLKIDTGEGQRRLADELADLRTPQVRVVDVP
jgi:multidrug efflux pump subunit AcrA (membrane-fusion protein)